MASVTHAGDERHCQRLNNKLNLIKARRVKLSQGITLINKTRDKQNIECQTLRLIEIKLTTNMLRLLRDAL